MTTPDDDKLMHLCSRLPEGFAFRKLLVTAAISVSLVFVVWCVVLVLSDFYFKARVNHCMENARAIHTACLSMATDGESNEDPNIGWPGDLKVNGKIATVADYANLLVHYGYLKPTDLKIFSGPGYKIYKGNLGSGSNGELVPAFTEEYCAFKIYLIKKGDSPDTLFLATKNYTFNIPLKPNAKPFGDQGFIVIRKGGDASFLSMDQAQSVQNIGKLPRGESVESKENCLTP